VALRKAQSLEFPTKRLNFLPPLYQNGVFNYWSKV